MSGQSTTHLIEKLIQDKLSNVELDQFLAGLSKPEERQAYSEVLEAYFIELLDQHEYQPEADKQPE